MISSEAGVNRALAIIARIDGDRKDATHHEHEAATRWASMRAREGELAALTAEMARYHPCVVIGQVRY